MGLWKGGKSHLSGRTASAPTKKFQGLEHFSERFCREHDFYATPFRVEGFALSDTVGCTHG
jgi:hypothetical protein